jgi:hypothetical protein
MNAGRGQAIPAADGGASIPVGHGLLAADGRVARFQTELSLVEADGERGVSVRGFSVDISDVTRAEEALAFRGRSAAAERRVPADLGRTRRRRSLDEVRRLTSLPALSPRRWFESPEVESRRPRR